MNVLISLLLVVEVITAFLLVLVILAQKSKDQGLGMAFGGGMGESLFGSRAGNVLTRLTVILAIVFMVSTVVLGMLYAKKGKKGGMSVMDDLPPPPPQTQEAPAAMPMPAPMVEDSQPTVLQMSEDGELVPVEAPDVVLDAPEAAAEAADAVAEEAEAAVEATEAAAEEAGAAVEEVAETVAEEAAAVVEEAAPVAAPAEE